MSRSFWTEAGVESRPEEVSAGKPSEGRPYCKHRCRCQAIDVSIRVGRAPRRTVESLCFTEENIVPIRVLVPTNPSREPAHLARSACTRQVLFTRSARITLCTRPELLLDRGVISLVAEFGLERDLLIPYKLSSTANAAARAPTHTRAERPAQ